MLGAADVAALKEDLQTQPIVASRAGARHLLKFPRIHELANDPRLLSLAAGWLQGKAMPFRATLFDKHVGSNWLVAWHQDTALPLTRKYSAEGWGPWSLKAGIHYAHAPAASLCRVIALRVHLDDSRSDNGPLRVIPGTHAAGVLSDAQVVERARRTAPVECCTPAGGVVAMRPLLIHASSRNRSATPRRVLHIEYAASMEIAPGILLQVA